ncbi:hypothetical protein G0Q06_05820 [Puniceicoccales bacterium CK1056]|uniref:Uncharacterized protein n=1 Tax=Oceanipulchritudo coccoides TaxID=2706888 RepID=A0A6B2M0P3_9BACT|nr:hypothetical protein [Oceanipulchritudo coccoides]NDV61962.1 hypothetical protein [Oceanipulchritudo coccoides]
MNIAEIQAGRRFFLPLICFIFLVLLGGCATTPPAEPEEVRLEEHYFYLNPNEEAFNVFLTKASVSTEVSKAELGAYYFADFLDAVFVARASEKYGYSIVGTGYVPETAREILLGESDKARFVSDDDIVDVFKLDVWWASFFATGEDVYLTKILDYAVGRQWTDEMAEVMGKAQRSFKSRCKWHKLVRNFAEQALGDPAYEDGKRYLRECLY